MRVLESDDINSAGYKEKAAAAKEAQEELAATEAAEVARNAEEIIKPKLGLQPKPYGEESYTFGRAATSSKTTSHKATSPFAR